MLVRPQGTTIYGGTYQLDHQTVNVTLKPGVGDIVAEIGGRTLIAECRGGVVNTRHAGQQVEKGAVRSGRLTNGTPSEQRTSCCGGACHTRD